jgi:hypothetical protein
VTDGLIGAIDTLSRWKCVVEWSCALVCLSVDGIRCIVEGLAQLLWYQGKCSPKLVVVTLRGVRFGLPGGPPGYSSGPSGWWDLLRDFIW